MLFRFLSRLIRSESGGMTEAGLVAILGILGIVIAFVFFNSPDVLIIYAAVWCSLMLLALSLQP